MKRTLLLLAIASLMCISVAAQQQRRRAPRNSSAQSDLSEVYSKWLGEDVVYIITAQEKQAFLMLKSNAEREQFIEQFWMRRDTNPATTENEYRTEYYSRIAYANENFVFGTTPGWRTDRGRIYIIYGKPDEVKKSSSGETWVYNILPERGSNVRVEFVDQSGTGDFRLRQ
jgi:GWxTD domain-containing protein